MAQVQSDNPGTGYDDSTTLGESEVVHHVSQRQKRNKRTLDGGSMQLNLTSMIDVVFQLLIYFVVTSNFAVGEGIITAKLPTGPGTPQPENKPPNKPLKIVVKSGGAIGTGYSVHIEDVAGRPSSFAELGDTLIQLQYDPTRGLNGFFKPDNPVIIKPGASVRWQHVVNAFNAAVRARYSNVSFAQAGAAEQE